MIEQAGKIAASILSASITDKFSGFDPFDGLNSRIFDVFPGLKSGSLGLAWIQFFKRSPVNLRSLLGVPKRRNPKGVALFILGLLEDHKRTQNPEYFSLAIELADWLLTQQCDLSLWEHSCWGYHFDWKARAFYVPKGKPNVITTVYVAQALFALADSIKEQAKVDAAKYRTPALSAAIFIVEKLYTQADGRCFFAYIPGETAFVHNASLWAAAWVAVVAAYTNNSHYRDLALKVARQSVNEQANDGSWVYGARYHHQFIDGFHTGYNLEALHLIGKALNTSEFGSSIKLGLTYYKTNFFEADGTAKYYNDNRYPLDMHSVAQAVMTLLKVGGTKADFQLVERVLAWSIDTLYLPSKQRFIYQKSPKYSNKINYVRWTQAWVYYSFSFYNRLVEVQNGQN